MYNRLPSQRTTNSCEGWHSRWNRRLGRCNPNFWVVLRKLKTEEKLAKIAVRSFVRGDPPPRQRKKIRSMNNQIQALKLSYARGLRTIESYWWAICSITSTVN